MSCVKHEQAVIVSTIVHHNNNNNNSNRFSTNPKLHFLSSPLPSVSKNQTLVWLPLPSLSLFSSLLSLLSITTFSNEGLVIAKEDAKVLMMMDDGPDFSLSPFEERFCPVPLISTFFRNVVSMFVQIIKGSEMQKALCLCGDGNPQVPNPQARPESEGAPSNEPLS